LSVSDCWLHHILPTPSFGACPVWLFVFHFAVPCQAEYSYCCTTFGLCAACTIIFLLSTTFLLTILATFYPSTGVLSSRTKGREPRSCQSWFVVASPPPLDPLVQAMTRACPGHAISPIPCLPTEDVLPPAASFFLLHLPHAFRPFPLHPRFMSRSS
jgi:hypothetical protein